MLNVGTPFLRDAWWMATVPGLAIFLTVLSINLLGDGLRDAFDPRLQCLQRPPVAGRRWRHCHYSGRTSPEVMPGCLNTGSEPALPQPGDDSAGQLVAGFGAPLVAAACS